MFNEIQDSKSTGTAYLDAATLKLVAKDILPAVTHIVNLSLKRIISNASFKSTNEKPVSVVLTNNRNQTQITNEWRKMSHAAAPFVFVCFICFRISR